ncbi:MAG: Acetate--CoA ligase [Bacteroidota bacterium]|jgi:acetyl-CoA synthetase
MKSLQINSFEEYKDVYAYSVENPEGFWGEVAEHFTWKKKWDQVLDWNFTEPKVEWFTGAQLNITENCLDRHLAERGDDVAILWESNDPEEASRKITYRELHREVCKFAHVLTQHGAKKGDRICLYMPMVPELTVAVLACARIGAIHSVVFGGFSAQSIADRIQDAACTMVVTADGTMRGNKEIYLKNIMDDALAHCPSVERVIVLERSNSPIAMMKGRDVFYGEEMARMEGQGLTDFPAVAMEAEDPLFILYTSGSTGKPKGVVHICAGYMVFAAYTFQNIFQYKRGQIYFCTADIGWITGHSYIVYGPLASGATNVMFEGIPTFPDAGRFWDIVDKFKVNILYTAPTAIRSLMAFGLDYVKNKDLSSLQVLGSVGEPINEEAWNWFNMHIGKGNCPIVDTWWQTETGGILISPLAHITPTKPCFATLPLPGVQPMLVDEKGQEILGNGVSGNLCMKFPWPGIIRTTYGDHERCRTTYFATYENLYFTSDGCMRDEDGYYRITGRVDDVMNISGHRIGTAEVENAINMHTGVIESAVVAFPHEIKGQGIYAYVILSDQSHQPDQIRKDISATVTRIIGAIARPDKIQFVTGLPKTRSGKIMRRILRKIAEGELSNLGDTSTLLDPGVVDKIKEERL